MLRLGCRYATEAGVMVCAPVHDAFWIEADTDELDDAIAAARAAATKPESTDELALVECRNEESAL